MAPNVNAAGYITASAMRGNECQLSSSSFSRDKVQKPRKPLSALSLNPAI
jgi:hypothetical protein